MIKLIICLCFFYSISANLLSVPKQNDLPQQNNDEEYDETTIERIYPDKTIEMLDLNPISEKDKVNSTNKPGGDPGDENPPAKPSEKPETGKIGLNIVGPTTEAQISQGSLTGANTNSPSTEEPPIEDMENCDKIIRTEQTIMSPNYPKPYPNLSKEPWCFELPEGPGIDIHIESIDLDPVSDYLLIRGGHNNSELEAGKLITGTQSNLTIRLIHTNQLYILFSSNQEQTESNEKFKGFMAHIKSFGEFTTTTTPPSTTVPVFTGDAVQIIKSLVVPEELQNDTSIYNITIRNAIVTATNLWIDAHNYTGILEKCLRENVIFNHVAQCSYTWPDHEKCVRIEFSIPINQTDPDDRIRQLLAIQSNPDLANVTGLNPKYELSEKHMEEMWREFGITELRNAGFEEYQLASAASVLILWTLACVFVLACFMFVLYCIWKADFLKDYSRMSESNENDLSNVKRPIDISEFTAPNQMIPKFLAEEIECNPEFGEEEPETTVYDVRNNSALKRPIKHVVKFSADVQDFNELPALPRRNPFAGEWEASDSLKRPE